VAHYFASDVHLRSDHPERDRRLCDWIGRLAPADALVIGGDLCDFWMAARPLENQPGHCLSLKALTEFRRRGGSLAIMAGNHDAWLCPFYARELGAQIVTEPYDLTIHGLRVRLVHGHRLGARQPWKGWMETQEFFRAFGLLPGPIARRLDQVLAWKNDRGLLADEERHLKVYRAYAAACRDLADIVVIGHVHRPVDEPEISPRLVVLGGWKHHPSYLRIDEGGAIFHSVGSRQFLEAPSTH
jgi:UDP-2,3-diacylglucosamine hydrolase